MRRVFMATLTAIFVSGCGGSDGGDTTSNTSTAEGKTLYEANCAACHGLDLKGTETGPPFLDDIYLPGHHPDESFQAAVENGVQPHHWNFGPMPPVPALDSDDVAAIVDYVRSVQEQNGFR